MDTEHLAEDIKVRVDIVELISERIDLKKAGQGYKGLCPFHAEKTPSFTVNPSRQRYHCFGCGKGGDIFTFIMETESMNFSEALHHLAARAGIRLEERKKPGEHLYGLKDALFSLNEEAQRYFSQNIAKNHQAQEYLSKRGFDGPVIEQFRIGYSLRASDHLYHHLRKKGFSDEHMRTAGLIARTVEQPLDFFRERIMFPILDLQSRVIGFGGRILGKDIHTAKYINSPDSPLFRKSETVYALDRAKKEITIKKHVIIVEGYCDAITCHRYGFTNAVAPLGTALTQGHLRKISRFSKNVVILFDGDPAGIAASGRALELVFAEGMTAKILVLPGGDDPDTFLRKNGVDSFRAHLTGSVTPVSFMKKYFSSSEPDRTRAVLEMISQCPDPLLRDETLRELSDGVNEGALREELGRIIRKDRTREKNRSVPDYETVATMNPTLKRIGKEERMLLGIALADIRKALIINRFLDGENIDNIPSRNILRRIGEAHNENDKGDVNIDLLLKNCHSDDRPIVREVIMDPPADPDTADDIIRDCLRKIATRCLQARILEAGKLGDQNLVQVLLRRKAMILSWKAGEQATEDILGNILET